ncbi:MAG: hypothetical protein SXA11_00470, partial [Cyanobacteriota bacterium]|nr:hypothetical protein [Cyanobacteriota bacterium]
NSKTASPETGFFQKTRFLKSPGAKQTSTSNSFLHKKLKTCNRPRHRMLGCAALHPTYTLRANC